MPFQNSSPKGPPDVLASCLSQPTTETSAKMAAKADLPRKIPLLILDDKVLLPGSSMRIAVRDAASIRMIDSRLLRRDSLRSVLIGVVPRKSKSEDSGSSFLKTVGTAAVVIQVTGTNWPKPLYTLLVTGLCRFSIDGIVQAEPYLLADVTQLDLPSKQEAELKRNAELASLAVEFRLIASEIVDMLDGKIPVIARLKEMLTALPDYNLPDTLASIIKASFDEKLEVLNATDLVERFKKALHLLKRQQEAIKANGTTVVKVNQSSSRLKPLSKKFGSGSKKLYRNLSDDDDNDDEDDIEELERKIKAAQLPEHAQRVAMKEIKRLKKTPPQFPEHATSRNYLEWMIDLPWSKETKDKLDIAQARRDLDTDHYGLEKLKKRVIEYLAVRKLKNNLKGPILCFVGPPGVGKTSVGRSVANTLGREFHRISLGGICDQSDIRGHRRTYVGSMPGRILNALKAVAVKNPVILLDEVDKLSKSLHGDPAAALLEVLDPEQNWNFVDHYLNMPFDLSQLIQVPGYTLEEKMAIASRHLIPKQLKAHGLDVGSIEFETQSIKDIISHYTREAGVRSLERKLGAVCRAVAVKVAESSMAAEKSSGNTQVNTEQHVISKEVVERVLGPPVFESEVAQRLSVPGVATGLAWTSNGGEIMFIEATRMGGEGQLTLTGQLGDVMKESAQLALSWLRSHAVEYGLTSDHEVDLVERTDIHVHFPAGAVGKDGPSAGVAIAVALVSLFSGQCTRSDTAMTGEITLRGLVLPVGGIKEKVLAAHRAGIKRVILPKRNEKDLLEIPDNVKSQLDFLPVSQVEEAIHVAFQDGSPFIRIPGLLGGSKL
ncbi:lon protease homolog 2, peroxisomal isoform X2 [Nematostella vectensis]|uniref:lon protease homolog 2, peroxisomal isoform X2 n=1 Tax=Nematostella vectensis TaxID=45351 RepID=UPI00207752F8|nr:lon protease homolog 2, peroxisomal isoform X2 [Nematostella vectensis]